MEDKKIECVNCGWVGLERHRRGIFRPLSGWTDWVCPQCACDSFYVNKETKEDKQ